MDWDKLFLIFLRHELEAFASIGGEFHLGSEHCNRPAGKIQAEAGCFTFFVIKIGIERQLLLQKTTESTQDEKAKYLMG